MTITVLLFGHYRDAAPAEAQSGAFLRDISEGQTVTELATDLAQGDPRFADILQRTRVAVGREFASPDTVLHSGDEVAFLPPMSGG